MHLTRDRLRTSKIIFNHIPKAGGTSLFRFFNEIFGAEHCFRHKVRDPKTDRFSPKIQELSKDQLETYNFLAGHFDFGNHRLIDSPVLYIGIIRDPIARVASDYYYNRERGSKKIRDQAMALTFEEYIVSKMKNPKSRLVSSAQTVFLSGQKSAEEAKRIIDKWYLACCTSDQLDDMQRMLARLYERPDLEPTRANVTKVKKSDTAVSQETLDKLNERFAEDHKLLAWVREKFESEYRDQTL